MLAHQVLKRAYSLIMEYSHFDAAGLSLDVPTPWNFYIVLVVIRKVIFISWESPFSRCIKIKFDESARHGRGDAGYVIRDQDARLLVAGGSYLFKPFILGVELLRVAWATIICVRLELQAQKIFVEDDFVTFIG